MAYNYSNNNNNNPSYYNQPNIQQMPQMQFQQPNVQPLFPQPQGNVYNINSTLEVANVPTGAGMSVALCIPEGFMYIKTMQNGNPMFWAYRIVPYDNTNSNQQAQDKNINSEQNINISEQLEQYNNRVVKLEEQVNNIQNIIKQNNAKTTNTSPKGGDWQL